LSEKPSPAENLRKYAEQQERVRLPDAPRHHPSDVRFYLAVGILIFIGTVLVCELAYAMVPSSESLQAKLDDFGLFDAGLMGLAGAVSAFYFSDRRADR